MSPGGLVFQPQRVETAAGGAKSAFADSVLTLVTLTTRLTIRAQSNRTGNRTADYRRATGHLGGFSIIAVAAAVSHLATVVRTIVVDCRCRTKSTIILVKIGVYRSVLAGAASVTAIGYIGWYKNRRRRVTS